MVHRLSILRVSALLATAVLAVSTSATTVLTDSLVVQRPLGEFLEAQGTFCLDHGRGGCFLSVPPVGNFLGWTSPRQNRAASVDYAGLANKAILGAGGASLGTVTEGTVLERPLTDGRAEITVTLHTRRALAWAIEGDGEGDFDFGSGRLLFGQRVAEVLTGARPALGDSLLEVVFTNPSSGAPLPDLEQILFAPAPGQELRFISFFASAGGPGREGMGASDEASGQMEVAQTGLLMRRFAGAAGGGVPAERIDLDSVAAAPSACRGKSPCDDGNPCTFGDRCKQGVCAGTPYSCDDGNACTADTCDGAGGCKFTNNTVPCSDGNACTSNDTCSAGACVSGPPTVCNDGNVCTTDSCDPASGCLFTTNNSTASCDDGNACTHTDTCSGGVCSGTAYTCNDGNACTTDACDGAGGCSPTPVQSCPACPVPEICGNGIDDDCDGLFDVFDPECACDVQECYTAECPPGYYCGYDGCCVPHCFDGFRNGDESDVDCGGSCEAKCAPGQHCWGFYDCASGVCINSVCQ